MQVKDDYRSKQIQNKLNKQEFHWDEREILLQTLLLYTDFTVFKQKYKYFYENNISNDTHLKK